jgi:arylformamidase
MIPAGDVETESLPNHNIFLGKEILLIENLTNLDKLPESSFLFYTIPLKIENADGSPVRAFAVING